MQVQSEWSCASHAEELNELWVQVSEEMKTMRGKEMHYDHAMPKAAFPRDLGKMRPKPYSLPDPGPANKRMRRTITTVAWDGVPTEAHTLTEVFQNIWF